MVFPSTPGVSVRVLRPMFVPGCGGPHEFVNSMSFSHFLSAVIPFPLSFCFSFSIALHNHHCHLPSCCLCFLTSPSSTFLSFHSPLPLPPFFLLFSSLSPFSPSSSSLHLPPCSPPCLEGPMGALWFVCWKAYQHRRRHHWNLSLFSLFALCLAHSFFFLFPSPLSLFFPPLFLMWKFWAIAGCFCGLVGMAFLEECLILWL